MADPKNTRGEPPREVHIEKKRTNWLAWLLLALGIIALLFALSRLHTRRDAAVTTAAATQATPALPVERVVLPGGTAVSLAPATLNYDLQRYLASGDAAPRTFTFDKLNFDTASATIRADDAPTLTALGQILQAYPKAKVTLVGYADARGSGPANAALGEQRARAVAQSLASAGIDVARLSVASGGATNPVATNDTASGQAENRRTELTVTDK